MTPGEPPITIVADSPAEALQRVREELGADAVVLSVRALPRPGLAKLWQRPRVEVRARGPAPAAPKATLHRLLDRIRQLNQQLPQPEPTQTAPALQPPAKPSNGFEELTAAGVLPAYARALAQDTTDVWEGLARSWRRCPDSLASLHVFVGAPGVGKTTVLCKWLAQVVLLGGQSARVWRLDGSSANTAESLSIYADILSVPLDRSWSELSEQVGFVDLPGVQWRDARAVRELGTRLKELGPAQVHLVLNAAYESGLLIEQTEAFSGLSPSDLIVTHLDEEPRWGKLWNLLLGTNCSIRFLAAGQNIPGTFLPASPRFSVSQRSMTVWASSSRTVTSTSPARQAARSSASESSTASASSSVMMPARTRPRTCAAVACMSKGSRIVSH